MGDNYYILIGLSFLVMVCVSFFVLLWKYAGIKRKYHPIINAEFESKKILNNANIEYESIKDEITSLKKNIFRKKRNL